MAMSPGPAMRSRERLLAAMRREQPDRVPFWNLWRARSAPFDHRDQVSRAEAVLALGLDDTLLLQPPLNKTEHYEAERAPGVTGRCRRQQSPDGPLLVQEWGTPAGTLRQVVQHTDDWPYGQHVRLFSDHNVSRSLRFPVVDEEDLPRLAWLLGDPSAEQVREFRDRAAQLRHEAERLGVVLEGGWTALGDAALWLLGTEALLLGQTDRPEFVEAVLDIVWRWEMRRVELLLEEGVDVLVHSAWYECTDFWTPTTFRQLLKPRLRRLVETAHQAGALVSYIITTSWGPLLDDLVEIGVDSLVGVDPVQGKAPLDWVREHASGRICLWGGVNGALTLGRGTADEIQRATVEAIETLGPGGGFVLSAVDQVVADTPWSNVEAMVRAWRACAGYPISIRG